MIKKLIKRATMYDKAKDAIVCRREYRYDRRLFAKMNSKSAPRSVNKISYDLVRAVHSIEKGLSSEKPRPFGIGHTDEIMDLLMKYDSASHDYNFSYKLAYSCLRDYCAFYEAHKWCDEPQYKKVKEFLGTTNTRFLAANTEPAKYLIAELRKGMAFDYGSFLKTRHSVRAFDGTKKVPESLVKESVEDATLSPSACNRQMIKVYDIRKKNNIDFVTKVAQGVGGFDLKGVSYLVITFDVNSLYFIGERNQGWFNAGLFSMNLMNALHSRGIGSCFIQFGNTVCEEERIKQQLNIPANERVAVFIAYGFYRDKTLAPRSVRKDLGDIYLSN